MNGQAKSRTYHKIGTAIRFKMPLVETAFSTAAGARHFEERSDVTRGKSRGLPRHCANATVTQVIYQKKSYECQFSDLNRLSSFGTLDVKVAGQVVFRVSATHLSPRARGRIRHKLPPDRHEPPICLIREAE